MQPEQLDSLIEDELKHISPGDVGADQATFWNEYAWYRREELKRNPDASPRLALNLARTSVRRYAPDFTPMYDQAFFGSQHAPETDRDQV